MKKLCLFFLFIASLFCTNPVSVYAETLTETESNSTKQTANLIQVNEDVIGNSYGEKDTDWYKFNIPKQGYFYFTFNHELIEDSVYPRWEIYLYDSSGATGIDGGNAKLTVYGNKNYTSANYGVQAGDYYIKIYSTIYEITSNYTLNIHYYESTKWETEINNTKNDADLIEVNETYNGSITWEGTYYADEDWYKFELKTQSLVTIKFEHELKEDSIYPRWYVTLYDDTGVNVPIQTLSKKYKVYFNKNFILSDLELQAGTYYFRVEGDTVYASSITYSLSINEIHDHQYGSYSKYNDLNHQRICSICNEVFYQNHTYDTGKVVTSATCKTTGISLYTCKYCGYQKEQVTDKTNDHSLGNCIYVNSKSHSRICSICSTTLTYSHNWNGGVIVENSTCTTKGIKTFTCLDCLGTKNEEMDYVHKWGIINQKDDEVHEQLCELCGETRNISHNWKALEIIKEPNCGETGIQLMTCSDCGENKQSTLPKKGSHTYSIFTKGDINHIVSCENCGDSYEENHQFGDPIAIDNQTHSSSCECGTVLVNDHNISNWVENKELFTISHVGTCSECNHTVENKTIRYQTIIIIGIPTLIILVSIVKKINKSKKS